MKKLTRLALLIALASSAGSVLATDPTPANFTVSVQVVPTAGGKPLYAGKAVAGHGRSVPFSEVREVGYLAAVTCHADGSIEMTPGTVKHGVSMTVVPSAAANGRISVDIVASMAQLVAMEEGRSECGPVHRPRVKMAVFRQTLSVRDGQEVTIPFGSPEQSAAGREADKPSHTIRVVARRV